ncbi:MAG: hypothetical protein HGA72_04680 [Chlorobiaceae bacterium]|nr:hypothetical protein [Chlorobiaceae bacterium]
MTNTEGKKEDPISENLYNPLEKAEEVSERLFLAITVMSLLLIVLTEVISTQFNHKELQTITSVLLVLNIIAIASSVALNLFIRLKLFPRAEDARRKDFVSKAFNVHLTSLRTKGYYNNEGHHPSTRIGLSVLENLLYTKRVLQSMIITIRIQALGWLIIFVSIILIRGSSLEVIYAISLVVFSENILVKWARMEWILDKAEKLFDDTYRILQLKLSDDELLPYAIDAFVDYEKDKATASILSSSKVFNKLQPSLDEEWEKIKTNLSRGITKS